MNRVALWTHISLKFVPGGSINNKVLLGQVMASLRTVIKPLSEPITAFYTDSSLAFVMEFTRDRWILRTDGQ